VMDLAVGVIHHVALDREVLEFGSEAHGVFPGCYRER
jgi:hypothetical protein